jgi:hypothetical protein
MAYELEAKDVSEKTANRISFTENANHSMRELVRGWTSVPDGRKATVLDYLYTIQTVEDPQYDNGKVHTGLWRVVNTSWNPQYPGYIQTLRYGWSTALAWDEVRIQQGENRDTADGGTALHMLIEIPNVAIGSEHTIAAALMAGSPWTNPTIQGVQRPGVFYCAWAAPQRIEGDGAYTIQAILSQRHGIFYGYSDSATFESETVIQLLHVPTKIVQALANSASYKTFGATLSPSYSQASNTWTLTVRQADLIASDSGDGTLVYEDIYQTTTEKQYWNQTSVPTLTFATGILKMISAAMDKFRRWRVEVRVTTSKYSLISFPLTTRLGVVAETHYIARFERPAVGGGPAFLGRPALTAGFVHDFVGNPSRNADGTWNWYLIVKTNDLAISIGQTRTVYRDDYITRRGETSALHNGGYPYPQVRWMYAIVHKPIIYKAYATADEAWADNPSMMPQQIAPGVWLATFVGEPIPFWQWDTYAEGPILVYP